MPAKTLNLERLRETIAILREARDVVRELADAVREIADAARALEPEPHRARPLPSAPPMPIPPQGPDPLDRWPHVQPPVAPWVSHGASPILTRMCAN